MPSFDFFLFLSCLMAKRKGVEVLHVSTRFPALTLFFFIFFFGKEIKQGFRR